MKHAGSLLVLSAAAALVLTGCSHSNNQVKTNLTNLSPQQQAQNMQAHPNPMLPPSANQHAVQYLKSKGGN